MDDRTRSPQEAPQGGAEGRKVGGGLTVAARVLPVPGLGVVLDQERSAATVRLRRLPSAR